MRKAAKIKRLEAGRGKLKVILQPLTGLKQSCGYTL